MAARDGVRILVVDDDADTVTIMCELLGVLGLDAYGVHCGEEALRCVREREPDLVFLDLVLPGMCGYEIAARMRAATHRRFYLAALTGLGMAKDRARTEAAGFDQHLLKPVAVGDLRNAVMRASLARLAG